MVMPRIPTFEELLKRIRQPKVPKIEELDDTQASELGYKLPSGWRLKRLEGIDSLISPRGLTFTDLKFDGGKITDFQAFRGDKPVRLPTTPVEPPPVKKKPEISEQFIYEELKRGVPISEMRARIEAMPPIEVEPPPPVEPLPIEAPILPGMEKRRLVALAAQISR
ncbi:unnamed protein product, partial [marine sediment metagenome]